MVRQPKANVFVTTPAEAAKGATSAVADGVHGSDLCGIGFESIAALQSVLLGRTFRSDYLDLSVLESHEQVFVYDELHGGWLFRFPEDAVRMLAEIPHGECHTLAGKWIGIFENYSRPPTLKQVEEMVRQLIGLARTALDERNAMYWLQEDC